MNKNQLVEILERQEMLVLSTLDKENKVHGSTMFFLVDKNLSFYLLTKSDTQKYENINAHSDVALTVIFTDEQKTVQCEGTIREVERATEEYRNVILQLSEKNALQGGISWPPPLASIPDSELIIYQVVPSWLRYGDFSNQSGEVFHQIIPTPISSTE